MHEYKPSIGLIKFSNNIQCWFFSGLMSNSPTDRQLLTSYLALFGLTIDDVFVLN